MSARAREPARLGFARDVLGAYLAVSGLGLLIVARSINRDAACGHANWFTQSPECIDREIENISSIDLR